MESSNILSELLEDCPSISNSNKQSAEDLEIPSISTSNISRFDKITYDSVLTSQAKAFECLRQTTHACPKSAKHLLDPIFDYVKKSRSVIQQLFSDNNILHNNVNILQLHLAKAPSSSHIPDDQLVDKLSSKLSSVIENSVDAVYSKLSPMLQNLNEDAIVSSLCAKISPALIGLPDHFPTDHISDTVSAKISSALERVLPSQFMDNRQPGRAPLPKPTYAEVLKSSQKTVPIVAKLVVSDTSNKLSGNDIHTFLDKNLNPMEHEIQVDGVQRLPQKVILHFANLEHSQQLKDIIQQKTNYSVKLMNTTTKLIIFNVADTLRTDDLLYALQPYGSFQPVKHFPSKKPQSNNWIIEAPTRDATNLLQYRSITIGFRNCYVKKFMSITRCYQCYDFGHTQTSCKNLVKCGKCSSNHETSTCKSSLFKCIYCSNSNLDNCNHPAYSYQCPVYKDLLQKLIRGEDFPAFLQQFNSIKTGPFSSSSSLPYHQPSTSTPRNNLVSSSRNDSVMLTRNTKAKLAKHPHHMTKDLNS